MPDDMTCHVKIMSGIMSADSFGHKEKIAKLRRKSRCNGVIWCEKVAKIVSNVLIHVYVPLSS